MEAKKISTGKPVGCLKFANYDCVMAQLTVYRVLHLHKTELMLFSPAAPAVFLADPLFNSPGS